MVQFEQFNVLISDSQESAARREIGQFHGIQFSATREIPYHTEPQMKILFKTTTRQKYFDPVE